jgi:membrane-bound serine protease (ClpP class)
VRGLSVRALLLPLLVGATLLFAAAAQGADTPKVLVINFDADVNPVTQDFVSSELKRAGDEHYNAAVIELNTPGGLLSSKDKIVLSELSAKVPVIVYVSPKGGGAGSAGVWIAEAADVLAMAPQTSIGSATPIDGSGQNIGSDLRRKLITYEAANLRGIMASHHRNASWADIAVGAAKTQTNGAIDQKMSRSDTEALNEHIIDLRAPDLPTLLKEVDGRHVSSPGRDFTLHTAGAHLDHVSLSFFQRLLNVLIDPQIIALLFLVGILGIGFEIFHPGVVLPGTIGAISFIAALWGLTIIPFSWAGIALILFGIALFVLEAHVPAHGAIAISGIISLTVGMLMLFRGAPAPYHVNKTPVITVAVLLGIAWAFVVRKAVQARHAPVRVGAHTLIGATGEARASGLVHVRGELWQAQTDDGEPLAPGEAVEVERVDGLMLTVRRAHDLQPTA